MSVGRFYRFVLFSFLLLQPVLLLAQETVIYGTVTDKLSGRPLPYASVALYHASDSNLISGVLSGGDGGFSLRPAKGGQFYLKIRFVGYQTATVSSFAVADGQQLDLGALSIRPDERMLKEIEVAGKRMDNYNQIDKQVYSADQFEGAKGGSALDVVKNLPAVSVNGQGEISLRGTTGFLVLIDGKPVLISSETALRQIPANAVAHIELITAPSAKYDPDGKAGIINVTTKQGAVDGVTLVANVQGGLPSTTDFDNLEKPIRFGGDLTLDYKKGKWNIAAAMNYSRNDVAGFRLGNVYTKNTDLNYMTYFPSEGERSFDKYNYGGRFSVGFRPDKNNSFAVGLFRGKRFQARLADIHYHNSRKRIGEQQPFQQYQYYNSNLQTKEGTFTLASLDYTHSFSEKSSLSASFLYENDNFYGDTKNRNLVSDKPGADTIQYVFNPYKKPITGYRAELDYSVALGKGKLETGYQFRHASQDGWYDYQVDPEPATPAPERFVGTATAENQIHAVYTQYSSKAGHLSYVGGLRYEYATRTVRLSYDPKPHNLYLSNLFPSANLLYTFNDHWKLKAGYSRRIQRTNNNQLNPIPEREHSETLEQGDPDLLPEFVNLSEIGLTRTLNKGSVFVTLYHQGIKNPIQRVNSVYNDTILNRVYTNAEKARLFGLEMGADVQMTKWWNLYLGGNLYNYEISGALDILGETAPVQNSAWVYVIHFNAEFQLAPSWSLQTNANYLSERPTAQGKDSRFLSPNLSVKKTFLDDKIAVSLQWQNMDLGFMGSNAQRITTWGPDFYTTTNYIYETDVLLINLRFHLNKRDQHVKLPKSEFGEQAF